MLSGWFMFIFNYALQPSGLTVRSGLDVPTFATRRLHAYHHARAPSGRKVELWARKVLEFCLNFNFHVTFRYLLHAVKLRHGTDGFTSPLKEGVLRIFFVLKIRRLRPGANPWTWVPKASTLPLVSQVYNNNDFTFVLNIRILTYFDMLWFIHTGYGWTNTPFPFLILLVTSSSVHPFTDTTLPKLTLKSPN